MPFNGGETYSLETKKSVIPEENWTPLWISSKTEDIYS
jgi:hypothetical protein